LSFRLERKFPLGAAGWPPNFAKLMVAGLAMAYVGAEMALGLGLGIDILFRRPPDIPRHWWMPSLKELWVILLIYWLAVIAGYVIRNLIHLHEREQEAAELALQKSRLESSLRQAELEALRTRLNPHFSFQLPAEHCGPYPGEPQDREPDADALGRTAAERTARRRSSRDIAGIRDYLTKSYVAVERCVSAKRLSVLFDIAPATQSALVPTFLLQPLIENAILHGLRGISRGELLWFAASLNRIRSSSRSPITQWSAGDEHVRSRNRSRVDIDCERLQRMYPGSIPSQFVHSPRVEPKYCSSCRYGSTARTPELWLMSKLRLLIADDEPLIRWEFARLPRRRGHRGQGSAARGRGDSGDFDPAA